jgi:hypothetical protein
MTVVEKAFKFKSPSGQSCPQVIERTLRYNSKLIDHILTTVVTTDCQSVWCIRKYFSVILNYGLWEDY